MSRADQPPASYDTSNLSSQPPTSSEEYDFPVDYSSFSPSMFDATNDYNGGEEYNEEVDDESNGDDLSPKRRPSTPVDEHERRQSKAPLLLESINSPFQLPPLEQVSGGGPRREASPHYTPTRLRAQIPPSGCGCDKLQAMHNARATNIRFNSPPPDSASNKRNRKPKVVPPALQLPSYEGHAPTGTCASPGSSTFSICSPATPSAWYEGHASAGTCASPASECPGVRSPTDLAKAKGGASTRSSASPAKPKATPALSDASTPPLLQFHPDTTLHAPQDASMSRAPSTSRGPTPSTHAPHLPLTSRVSCPGGLWAARAAASSTRVVLQAQGSQRFAGAGSCAGSASSTKACTIRPPVFTLATSSVFENSRRVARLPFHASSVGGNPSDKGGDTEIEVDADAEGDVKVMDHAEGDAEVMDHAEVDAEVAAEVDAEGLGVFQYQPAKAGRPTKEHVAAARECRRQVLMLIKTLAEEHGISPARVLDEMAMHPDWSTREVQRIIPHFDPASHEFPTLHSEHLSLMYQGFIAEHAVDNGYLKILDNFEALISSGRNNGFQRQRRVISAAKKIQHVVDELRDTDKVEGMFFLWLFPSVFKRGKNGPGLKLDDLLGMAKTLCIPPCRACGRRPCCADRRETLRKTLRVTLARQVAPSASSTKPCTTQTSSSRVPSDLPDIDVKTEDGKMTRTQIDTAHNNEVREYLSGACTTDVGRDLIRKGTQFRWKTCVSRFQTEGFIIMAFPATSPPRRRLWKHVKLRGKDFASRRWKNSKIGYRSFHSRLHPSTPRWPPGLPTVIRHWCTSGGKHLPAQDGKGKLWMVNYDLDHGNGRVLSKVPHKNQPAAEPAPDKDEEPSPHQRRTRAATKGRKGKGRARQGRGRRGRGRGRGATFPPSTRNHPRRHAQPGGGLAGRRVAFDLYRDNSEDEVDELSELSEYQASRSPSPRASAVSTARKRHQQPDATTNLPAKRARANAAADPPAKRARNDDSQRDRNDDSRARKDATQTSAENCPRPKPAYRNAVPPPPPPHIHAPPPPPAAPAHAPPALPAPAHAPSALLAAPANTAAVPPDYVAMLRSVPPEMLAAGLAHALQLMQQPQQQ
ncbi:hypothetical protein B0H13DRAFT_2373236 [Mycena leptocephala]|nr:hypothetical protein B0H13DRAFT_2373236 [Mycena leptocephala]